MGITVTGDVPQIVSRKFSVNRQSSHSGVAWLPAMSSPQCLIVGCVACIDGQPSGQCELERSQKVDQHVQELPGTSCEGFCRDSVTGLYLECSGRGCNGRAGGLGDGSPPAGSRGRTPVGVWGPPEAIGTM